MSRSAEAAQAIRAHLRRVAAARQSAAAWRDSNARSTRQRFLDPLETKATAVADAVAQHDEPFRAAIGLIKLVAEQARLSASQLGHGRALCDEASAQFATATAQLAQTQTAIADCEHHLQQAINALAQAGRPCGRGTSAVDLMGSLDQLILDDKVSRAQADLVGKMAIGLAPFLAQASSEFSPVQLEGIDNLVSEGIQIARDPAYRQRFVEEARQAMRFDQIGAAVDHIRRSLS